MGLYFTGIIIAVSCFLIIGVDIPYCRHRLRNSRLIHRELHCVCRTRDIRSILTLVYKRAVRAA